MDFYPFSMPGGGVNRRNLLKGTVAAVGSALPGSGAPLVAPRAAVTGLEIFYVKVNRRGNWLIPRIRTSAGVTGIGDSSQSGDDAATVRFLHQFFEALKGRSIYDVEWFRATVRPTVDANGQPAAVAASALEHCLWDIHGQILSLPTYELFGGRVQSRIRNYANINRSTDPRTPDGFARMAERAVAAGFDAVKLAPFDDMPKGLTDAKTIEEFTQRGLECAAAVRRTIGPKRDLLVDAHSHFNVERGIELARRFEPLNLFWLEEVTPAKPIEDLSTINRVARMPTAGGETVRGVEGFYPYIAAGAVDIVMPDVKFCGGMLELRKIAALAEGARLRVAPHGPASPVGNAVAAQVCATMPNFLILEFSYGEVPWRAELIDPPETIVDSALPLSTRPGLGIRLNEKTAAKYAAVIR
jgi:galactonate dehydratase